MCVACVPSLNFRIFKNSLTNMTLLALLKLKQDQYDEVNIDGYKFISVSRALARRKSGGVGLFINNTI